MNIRDEFRNNRLVVVVRGRTAPVIQTLKFLSSTLVEVPRAHRPPPSTASATTRRWDSVAMLLPTICKGYHPDRTLYNHKARRILQTYPRNTITTPHMVPLGKEQVDIWRTHAECAVRVTYWELGDQVSQVEGDSGRDGLPRPGWLQQVATGEWTCRACFQARSVQPFYPSGTHVVRLRARDQGQA